jgi:predicted Zn-dependent protease
MLTTRQAARRPRWRFVIGLVAALAALPVNARTLIRDAEIEATLGRLANPIFQAAGVAPGSVKMLIMLDSAINAFVVGGRTMVLYTGLMQRFDRPEALIGVIAHETGHITGGHIARRTVAAQQMTGPALIASIMAAAAIAAAGSAQGAAAAVIGGQDALRRSMLAYSRAEEAAADQAALNYMARAGVDPDGMLDVLRLFQGQEVFQASRIDPYAQTHPLSSQRISLLERRVAESPARGTPTDPEIDYWFQRMRAKLDGFIERPERLLANLGREGDGENEFDTYRRAIAHHRLAETDRALAVLDRLLDRRPNDPYYHALRGQFLFEGARPAEAVEAYRRAVALAPGEPLIAGNLGRALLATGRAGDEAEALAVLERALRDDPGSPSMLRDLAIAHGRAGNDGLAALASAERLAMLGELRDAATLAQRAMALLPQGSPSWQRADDLALTARQALE